MTRKKYRPQRDDSILGDPYSQDDSTPQPSIVVSTVGHSATSAPSSSSGTATRHVPVSHSDDEGNVIVDVSPTAHTHFNPIVPIVPIVPAGPVVIHELEEADPLPPADCNNRDVVDAPDKTGTHNTEVCPDCIETAATLSNGSTATATATATATTNDANTIEYTGVTTSTAVVAKIVDDVVNNVVGVGVGVGVDAATTTATSAQPSPANKWTRFKTWFLSCLSCSCCCQRKRRTSVQLK